MDCNDLRDFYIEIDQNQGRGLHFAYTTKLYLFGLSDYIIQCKTNKIRCPFCNNLLSIHSFDCPNCGHTIHKICEKLYSDWKFYNGHKYSITWSSIKDYPIDKQQKEVHNAVRRFIIDSIPFWICNYFKEVINEMHLSTLVLIYKKSLGIEKVKQEIIEEIDRDKKIAFIQAVRNDLKDDVKAMQTAWRYFQLYLKYKAGSHKIKASDFSISLKLFNAETKDLNINFFDNLYLLFRKNAEKCLGKSYKNDIIVNYNACKSYLVYMALNNLSTSMKYIIDLVTIKIYGDMNLSNDTIYRTVNISLKDTIEETEYLRYYHKGCCHNCEKVYLKIPLLLSTGEIIIRTLLGTYCDKCKKYFILDTEFKKILIEGKIQAQISFSDLGDHFSGKNLSPESLLRKCGYSVSANLNISKEYRQKLLKAIIDNGLYSPAKIVSHFRFLISMNKNVTSRDMTAAISKWQEDIIFLQQNHS